MRTKDESRKRDILDFVEDYIMREGRSPSLGTVAEGVNLSKSVVYRYLMGMNDEKELSYDGQEIITPRTRKCNPGVVLVPLLGNIRCGDPSAEEANVEEYVRMPSGMFGSEEAYMLRAWGDSMEDAGIEEGDIIVVHRKAEPKKGDLIVAQDQNGDNTLKEYGGQDSETGKAKLLYRNEAVYGDKVILVNRLFCQGVVKFIIKKVH